MAATEGRHGLIGRRVGITCQDDYRSTVDGFPFQPLPSVGDPFSDINYPSDLFLESVVPEDLKLIGVPLWGKTLRSRHQRTGNLMVNLKQRGFTSNKGRFLTTFLYNVEEPQGIYIYTFIYLFILLFIYLFIYLQV